MTVPPLRPPEPPAEPADFEAAAIIVATEMVRLLVNRHRKYGPANIARHGEKGVVVRMGDKLARLEYAYGMTPTCHKCGASYGGDHPPLEEADFDDETLEDAWLDGGNYPIVALMFRRGWWYLPMREPTKDCGGCDTTLATAEIEAGPCSDGEHYCAICIGEKGCGCGNVHNEPLPPHARQRGTKGR